MYLKSIFRFWITYSYHDIRKRIHLIRFKLHDAISSMHAGVIFLTIR